MRIAIAAPVSVGFIAYAVEAFACGCFAAPAVDQPVVQAGERIVFAHEDGNRVAAHIQIQYEGAAKDFAWMLPTSGLPEFRLGSEALFDGLEAGTAPQFQLIRSRAPECFESSGCSDSGDDDALAAPSRDGGTPADDIAVRQSSAGPYDYAVLRASEKQPLLDWLRDNEYFVPATSDDAIDQYIHEGAYFLVLKLTAGATTGDLQPVVVEYESDRAMIPIVLTSVSAIDDMGVLVWVLGRERAIPLNYQHAVINEHQIEWTNQARNYTEVVARAVDEAADGHAFVTEYAGSTAAVRLPQTHRSGDRGHLATATTPYSFVSRLESMGFDPARVWPILQRAFDMPSTTPRTWAAYEEQAQLQNEETFDSFAVADEIWEKIVEPTDEARALVGRNRYVTRMFTTLDAAEMTEDPVFAFNPDLPDVDRLRVATSLDDCDGRSMELRLNGNTRVVEVPRGVVVPPREGAPYAARIEILRLEGPPMIVTDNQALLAESDRVEDGGCNSTSRRRSFGGTFVAFLMIAMLARVFVRSTS